MTKANIDIDTSGDTLAPAGPRLSKLDHLIALLGGPDGASMAQMMAVTAWQAHSIRGAMAGALKRKGYTVVSAKAEVGRRWRIMQEAGQ
ncbi:DUF3489 domain-containing protein [Brevundimonas vancanneytii]|jgi:hypothetical protein|uniref:Protein of uncharacterized function (DUF3489) n=1 Tax=Brevundimonas vancanneytii TaxID=1325724 RepID=A0A4P1KAI0_9CAUL|nr:DUF3489 domain-containing protein [Brevundimonas vancanneytii]VTO16741.1 Protein of uncharacterised function (DUF3489) [Brevundimonas vancanneytii]